MRLIDADALEAHTHWECFENFDDDYEYVLKTDIDHAPTIDAEPKKRGRWVHKFGDGHIENAITGGECSICGFVNIATHYCPNCGAKMDLADRPEKNGLQEWWKMMEEDKE